MKKVLWISRHKPQPQHQEALEALLQDAVGIDHQRVDVRDARRLVRVASSYDECVLNAPLGVFQNVLKQGVFPLWVENVQETDSSRIEYRHAGCGYRFNRIRRVVGVGPVLEELQPLSSQDGGVVLWVSNFPPHASQVQALQKRFGEKIQIHHQRMPSSNAARVIARWWRTGGYVDVAATLPMAALRHLCDEGVRPLWPHCVEENDPEKLHFRGAGGQGFCFERFMRLKAIDFEFED